MTMYCGWCYREMERHTKTLNVYGRDGSVKKNSVVVYRCPYDHLETINSTQKIVPKANPYPKANI